MILWLHAALLLSNRDARSRVRGIHIEDQELRRRDNVDHLFPRSGGHSAISCDYVCILRALAIRKGPVFVYVTGRVDGPRVQHSDTGTGGSTQLQGYRRITE